MTQSNIRKKHSNILKFKIALEAFKEEKTIAVIAKEFSIHPSQINKWKKQLKEKGPIIFNESSSTSKDHLALKSQIDDLNRYIGELSVENQFFKKKLNF
jgi:transposase-like protein